MMFAPSALDVDTCQKRKGYGWYCADFARLYAKFTGVSRGFYWQFCQNVLYLGQSTRAFARHRWKYVERGA